MTTIHEFLRARGYRGGSRDPRRDGAFLYHRTFGGHPKPCLVSGTMELNVVVYDFEFGGYDYHGVVFEIDGWYRDGVQTKIEVRVSFKRAMAECERIENDLLRAWSAMDEAAT